MRVQMVSGKTWNTKTKDLRKVQVPELGDFEEKTRVPKKREPVLMRGDIHRFEVIGTPIAKKRARFVTSKGKNGADFTRNVNVQQTEEGRFLWEILTHWDNKPLLVGALRVAFEFVFERPKSHFGTGRNAWALKSSSPAFCLSPKDLDNLEKFAMDSMNRYIYKDDRQVVELSSLKRWADNGESAHTKIMIEELEE